CSGEAKCIRFYDLEVTVRIWKNAGQLSIKAHYQKSSRIAQITSD
ncbi:4505_t:CDS:1, partial [Gigaspora rosea]